MYTRMCTHTHTHTQKVVKVKEQPQSSSNRKRKSSPRKLSSSSIDNIDKGIPSTKAKLDTVEERGRDAEGGRDDGGTMEVEEGEGKEEIQVFTSAPLPMTAYSEVGIMVEY